MPRCLSEWPEYVRAVHRAIARHEPGEAVLVHGHLTVRGAPLAWRDGAPAVSAIDAEQALGWAYEALKETLDETWNQWAADVRAGADRDEADTAHSRAYHLGMREALGILIQAGASQAGLRIDAWDAVRDSQGKRWAAPKATEAP